MLKTRNGLPKHYSWNTDRHGKRRVRFRKGGFTTYLSGTPWSPAFMEQYGQALEGVKAQASNIGAERTIPGSLDALCVSYYRSPEFHRLQPSTQAVRRNVLERFRNEHGKKPIASLGRVHIKQLIATKSNTPHAANNLLKILRVLLAHAVDIDMIRNNPAIDVERYATKGDGIHSWSEREVAQFEAYHPIGSKARLALALMLCTAARRSDTVRLGWQHIQNDAIGFRQHKTDAALLIPIHPELAEVLSATPRNNLTFLVTEHGKPFTAAGFGNWFRDRCNEAGLPQCSAHGLRKCAATRLADAGCSLHQVMAITGHKSMSEVARYTKAADQARLAREAMHKLSNLKPRLDKKRKKP